MHLRRGLGYEENLSDLTICQPLLKKVDDFSLSFRKRAPTAIAAPDRKASRTKERVIVRATEHRDQVTMVTRFRHQVIEKSRHRTHSAHERIPCI